ncbi:MAG: cysteine peptidase family C39 domain-containing protein [Nanoarchaeota archaeon]
MLNVKPMRQTPSYCGPFCLKMVFDYYGKEIDEKEIAKVAGTIVNDTNVGTSPFDMVNAAKHYGFNVKYIENSNLAQLREFVVIKKIPVIINWFYENEGHYSVVVGIDKLNVYFIDPEDAHYKKISLSTFSKVWFDFKGEYIKSKNDLRLRPMIVVTRKK